MGALVISILAAVVAVLAIAWAWRLQQEMERLTRRLDRYNRSLFDASDHLRTLEEELKQTTAALHVETMQRAGALQFTPNTTVREAELIHPQAMQVLAGFHLGGCESCAVEPDTTLEQACLEKGADMNALLGNLNLLTQSARNGGAPEFVKLPNLTLELS